MRTMLVGFLLSIASTIAVNAQENQLTQEEISAGWLSLFDGESLFGWQAHGKADWRAENGAITASSGEQCLLCTNTPFADYELSLEFRAPAATNSGIFLRTPPVAPKEVVGTQCYELNIAGLDNPFPTGSLVQRLKSESDCQGDGWRAYHITCDGERVTVKYQGKQVIDYTDKNPLGRGFIGLQHNAGKIEFRNIKLKPLNLGSLFNGKNLAGWKEYPDMASKFSVAADGTLHVQNGKGQLESRGGYGDFTLQLECRTNAANLNSGLFFRCIPGEQMNGYESQIHNGYKDGDRTKPVDCGTGGIFRRVDARRVVADDKTWFSKTIIATGPHMAVWVNGYQVTDWTDTRKPDPNPRKGLRTEAGTFMIQGHDPTTDISFRNLAAAEMPARKEPK